jgi:glycosyltransferase involved in cell wall biosynthesis
MGNSVEYLSKALNKAGVSSTVITPLYSDISDFDKTVTHLEPLFEFGNAACLPQLLFALRKYDIIHLHYPFYGAHLSTLLACLIWRKPLVIFYHMDTEAPGLKGLAFKLNRLLVEPLLLKYAGVVMGSSVDYLENSYIAGFVKKNPAKVFGIPFGARESLLEPLDGVEKSKTLLFVGALDSAHYFKGLSVLFEALAILKDAANLDAWTLEIVGDGDLRKSYIKTCMDLGILDSVNFLGKIDDTELKAKYRQSGCLILPSTTRGEAFGIVLIEAMVSGTPVIASNLPGVRSVFKDKAQGLLVEPGNAEDLAAAIRKMLTDEDFRIKAGRHAREYALGNYTAEIMAGKTTDLYNKVLAE